MKILKMFFAFALLFNAAFALADPPAQVGRLNYLSGVVSFAPAEANSEWGAATLNRPMTTGDRLWADADGRAEMHIGSTAIRIPAFTSLDVLSLDDRGVQLRLAQGSVNVRLRRLDAGENFEISTPGGAVLLTQPGSYRVIVDPAGTTTTILVRRGQADVLTGEAPLTIGENQIATVSGSGQQIAAAPPVDEFDNWSAIRDRREDNVAATRYVPQEMTGYEDLDQYGTWSNVAQYGTVWYPTAVPAGWAPYRQGHWVWISPWGWTWVDDAPWGFAPSHYGRWVWIGNRWAWAPGTRVARPMYAPALVAFVGGANWAVSISSGPAVGWVPLGWREPYIPWYRTSPTYVRNVNVTHVTNINVINQYTNVGNVNNIRYVNRSVPAATTVVTREAFVSAQRADRASVQVPAQALANARISHEAPVARPERASLIASRPGPRLPDAIATREVLAAKAPPTPARVDRDANAGNDRAQFAQRDDRARVRVVSPQSQRVAAPAQQPATETRTVQEQPGAQAEQKRQQQIQQREQERQAQQERQRQQMREPVKPAPEQQAQQVERQRQLQQERARQEQQKVQEQRDQQQANQRAQQEERQRQQQRTLSEQQVQQQSQQMERQAQQERLQQEQQRARDQQQANQRAQQEERQRQLQQQRAQQQQEQTQQRVQQEQQRERQQRDQLQARQNQLQQQRAQQEQQQRAQQEQQQRVQQERVQREQQQFQQEERRQLQQQRVQQQQEQQRQRQAERSAENRPQPAPPVRPPQAQPQSSPQPQPQTRPQRQQREQPGNGGDRDK